MVATVLRLRLTLLRNTLRAEPWRLVLLVIGGAWAVLLLPTVLNGAGWLSRQTPAVAHDVLVVAGAVLMVGWGVVPVVLPSLDDSLDVRRFATTGVPPRRLVPGLLLASLLGVPTAFTAMVCLAPVIVWGAPGTRPALALAVLLAPVLAATYVVTARVTTGLVARALGARRARETGAVLALLAVVALAATVAGVRRLGLEGVLERVPAVAQVLGWTPVAAGWAAPAALAQGDVAGAVGRAVVAVGWLALALVAWTRLLRLTVVRPPAQHGPLRRRADGMLPAAVAAGRLGLRSPGAVAAVAVLRRSLRSWTADPRYGAALLGSVAAPVVIVVLAATVVDAPAAVPLGLAPFVAGSVGWGRHNDVAFDGSAFWLHVAARVPGWADRAGRAGAVLVWAVPLTVAVGVVGAGVAGRADLAVASVGAGLGVLAAGLGVSAVTSAALVYPVPEVGGDPYAAPAGSVGASLVAQLVSSLATTAVCVPVLAVYAAAVWGDASLGWAALAVGVLGGGATLWAGVVLGGRVLDTHGVRLLARLRS